MRGRRFLTVACLALAMGLSTSVARAEDTRVASLRSAATSLAARVKTLRTLAERAPPSVRRESERILDVVDDRGVSLSVRLDILDLVGGTDSLDDATIADMQREYDGANRLLAVVEGWYAEK